MKNWEEEEEGNGKIRRQEKQRAKGFGFLTTKQKTLYYVLIGQQGREEKKREKGRVSSSSRISRFSS